MKDFIDYPSEKEDMEATLEILSNRKIMSQINEAEIALQKGNLNEFIPWNKAKRNI